MRKRDGECKNSGMCVQVTKASLHLPFPPSTYKLTLTAPPLHPPPTSTQLTQGRPTLQTRLPPPPTPLPICTIPRPTHRTSVPPHTIPSIPGTSPLQTLTHPPAPAHRPTTKNSRETITPLTPHHHRRRQKRKIVVDGHRYDKNSLLFLMSRIRVPV